MGKWNKELILERLDTIVKAIGKFPTHQKLVQLEMGDLRNAIILSGKPISYYAELMGLKTKQRSRDYWNPITVKEELRKVCDQLGYFPTQKDLFKLGLRGLHFAMWRHGENIQYWQNLLGYEQKVKEKGYWNDETILKEFIEFSETIGFMPTQQILNNNGRHDLSRAIDRSGKGMAYFQKLAGFEPPFYEATDGHWLDSSYELMLDEWLYSHGIRHEVHGYIDKSKSRYRYDFKIGDTYVEIWGYPQDYKGDIAEAYNEKREKKEIVYKELGLEMIPLEAKFFSGSQKSVESRIEEIFSRFI